MNDINTLFRFIVLETKLFLVIFILLFCLSALARLIKTERKLRHPPEGLDRREMLEWKLECLEEEQNSFPLDILGAIDNFFEKRRKRK